MDKEKHNERKILTSPEMYIGENTHFENLRDILILIYSIPFEINQKMNSYLTVA